ncbi:MAG: (4Fe-4S)-binding protein [Cytophagaceae bacterium]
MIKKYSNREITVTWKPEVCTHSKNCWKSMLKVFNPQLKPWINLEAAGSEEIMAQIDRCPSNALSYQLNEEKA